MHPAFSVIFFTVGSGAGYGLLALLGVMAAAGMLPADRLLGFIAMALSLGLISAGLLSSTAHLGRPERAWRAFSQWRSSWLSREGVLSVATFVPAGVFAIAWVFFGQTGGWVGMVGLLAAIGAVATVTATAMIYASLKPIAQWASGYTLPAYLIFAAMTGAVLLNAILWCLSYGSPMSGIVATVLVALGWYWKIATWRHNADLAVAGTINSATGLAKGNVNIVEWPHTQENYLLKEMGFQIARKHADRLRTYAHILAFAIPLFMSALTIVTTGGPAIVGAIVAVLSQTAGMLTERWLFFAEARHTVSLYYRGQ